MQCLVHGKRVNGNKVHAPFAFAARETATKCRILPHDKPHGLTQMMSTKMLLRYQDFADITLFQMQGRTLIIQLPQ